ncbi:MAG: hypothetical protein AAF539_15590, partial [Planctomycetota bacterium]
MIANTITMANGTSTVAQTQILAQATGGDLTIGLLDANRVSLDAAAAQIIDGNDGSVTNVRASSARLSAATGIGGAPGSGPVDTNNEAIDLEVGTIAAESSGGIYLQQLGVGGDLLVNSVAATTVTISIERSAFDSSTVTESVSETLQDLEDLSTTGGNPIKVVALDGTITIGGGSDGIGVSAGSDGDVLLQSRGSSADIVINASVDSGSGHVTFDAARGVAINAEVSTGGVGTIVILAGTDIEVDARVQTTDGDILLEASESILQNALVDTSSGDVGLIANSSIAQSANGDITSDSGDVFVHATGNWSMDAEATITAGGQDVVGISGGTIRLGVIQVTDASTNRVALSAAVSILDANEGSVNVLESDANSNTTLSLRAFDGSIGLADSNSATGANTEAIDLNVDVVAANSADGIYLREITAGGSITVDSVAAASVVVGDVLRTQFNSTTTTVAQSLELEGLEDLRSTDDGPIKLVAEGGTITINGGSDTDAVDADGNGDVLIEARSAGSRLVINDSVTSDSGHVTIDAESDVELNAALATGADGSLVVFSEANILSDAQLTTVGGDILLSADTNITQPGLITSTEGNVGLIASASIIQTSTAEISTARGDVLLDAGADWTMDGDATITAGGQQVIGQSGGTITLGVIQVTDAIENHVALSAAADILDANAADINVSETVASANTTLSLRAGSGTIGQADPGPPVDDNTSAIDLNIDTVAARSATGIYLREVSAGGAVTVDIVQSVIVDLESATRSNFNSSTSDVSQDRTLGSLEDLTTTSDGPIKIVAESGTLTVNAGSGQTGIAADGAADILVEARDVNSNVVINGSIVSESGHITLDADSVLTVDAIVSTGGDGTVVMFAGETLSTDAVITTVDGDILLSADSITQDALITTTTGDVGLLANATINQNEDGDITTIDGDVVVDAGSNWTMNANTTITGGGQDVLGISGGSITLGIIQVTDASVNRVSLSANGNIFDANGTALNVTESIAGSSTSLSLRSMNGSIGKDDLQSSADENTEAIDVNVDRIAAASATGIYVRESGPKSDVIVGSVAGATVNVDGVVRSRFNSSTSDVSESRTLDSLEDLTTSGVDGDIKLIAEDG